MSGADVSKSKLTTSLSRLSKMDILAQKQNRIADRKLSDAITSIDRERAAFKVNHRSLLQELRWELQDVRSSTGHSDKGRPPTVDELQRMNTWMPSRPSGGSGAPAPMASRQRGGAPPPAAAASHRGGLLPLREVFSPVREGTPPEYAYSDTDSDDGLAAAAAAYGSLKPSRACGRDDRQHASAAQDASTTSGDGREQQLNEASSSPKPLPRPHSSGSDDLTGEQAAATTAASAAAAADAADEHDSPEQVLVTGKLEEMKRIMKMPTIYQTQELQKQRGLPRHVVSLPPIKFFDDDDDDVTEETVAAVHRGGGVVAAAVGRARRDERHLLLLPELLSADGGSGGGGGSVAKADGSHASNKMVSMSAELPSEAKKAAAAAAAVVQAPLKALTKATSVGTVYKPENIRFVGRSFTKEELVTQHRSLLEQNRAERDVNPGKVQMTRLQSRVDAFLSLVSVAPAGSTGRGGASEAQTRLPPVALGSGVGVPARLTVVEKRRSGAR